MHRHGHGVQQKDRPGAFGNPAGVQLAEQPVDYPVPDPAAEVLVNYVPAAVFLGQPPLFAPVFAYVRQCVYEGSVPLPCRADGQYVPDFPVCPIGYFHASSLTAFVMFS